MNLFIQWYRNLYSIGCLLALSDQFNVWSIFTGNYNDPYIVVSDAIVLFLFFRIGQPQNNPSLQYFFNHLKRKK